MDPYIWVPLSVAMQVVSLAVAIPKRGILSLCSALLPVDVFWSISSLVFLSFDVFGIGTTSSLLFVAPLVHIVNSETRSGLSLVLLFASFMLAGDSWTYWESMTGLETRHLERVYLTKKDIHQMNWVTALSLCIILKSVLRGGGVPLFLSSRAESISIGMAIFLLVLDYVQIEQRMVGLLSVIGLLVATRLLQFWIQRKTACLLVFLLPNIAFLASGMVYLFVANDDNICTKSILGSLFHAVSAGYISFLLSSSVEDRSWLRRGTQTSLFLLLLTASVLPAAFLSERESGLYRSSFERGSPVWMQMYHYVYVESTGNPAIGLDECRSEAKRYFRSTGSRSLLLFHDRSTPRGYCWFKLDGEVRSPNCHLLKGREGEWLLDDGHGGWLGEGASLADCRQRGWKEYCDVSSVDYRLGSTDEVDSSSEERSPCAFVFQFGSEMDTDGVHWNQETHCLDPNQGVLQLCKESTSCERKAVGWSCLAVLGVSLLRLYTRGEEIRRRTEERKSEGPA